MAPVDEFLKNLVSPGLEPGESILGTGLLRRPTRFTVLGAPTNCLDYLAVATDRRLIIFETDGGVLITAAPVAQMVAHTPIEWRYDELARVGVAPVTIFGVRAIGLQLVPHPGWGPLGPDDRWSSTGSTRYDFLPSVSGLDGQSQLHQLPQWLDQRVKAGAFPMSPERRAQVERRVAEAHAQRVAAGNERERRKKVFWSESAVPALIIGAALALGGVGISFIKGGLKMHTHGDERITWAKAKIAGRELDLKTWVRDPKLVPPNDCPEKKWPNLEGHRRENCHGCFPVPTDDTPARSKKPGRSKEPEKPSDRRTFQREGQLWMCPDVQGYEWEIAETRKELAHGEEQVDGALVKIGGGAASGLAGVGVLVGGFLIRARRRKAVAA